MAILTSDKGYFEVTEISFTPNIITMGEETEYTITIKNTSTKKITSLRAIMQLYYECNTATNGWQFSNEAYMFRGDGNYNMGSIDWPANSTHTFTGKVTFTPVQTYPPTITTRKMGFQNYSSSVFGEQIRGLMLNIAESPDAEFPDGSNTDMFPNLCGDNNEYLTVIDKRYNPRIFSFSALRSTNGILSDEGENLLCSMKASIVDDAIMDGVTLIAKQSSGDVIGENATEVDLTPKISEALAGITDSTTILMGTFSKSSEWIIKVSFGDQYEKFSINYSVERAFANLHLSGCDTGGACFGGFSTSTEGNPKLETYYRIYAYGGIENIGADYSTSEVYTGVRWIDGKQIYRRVFHGTTALDGAQGIFASFEEAPETIVDIRTMCNSANSSGTQWRPVPNSYYGSLNTACGIYVDGKDIYLNFGSNFNGTKTINVIIDYTKPSTALLDADGNTLCDITGNELIVGDA